MRADLSTSARGWLALVIALVDLFLASWIFLPAPTYFLLIFGVGAPEICAWLLAAALVAVLLIVPELRHAPRPLTWWTLALSAAAFLMASSPLLRFRATARRAEASMHAALGADPLKHVAPSVRAGMRASPLSVADLFRGIPIGAARVTRGIAFASPGGVALTMDVYRPERGGSYPALVQIYGGAWRGGEPGSFANFARWLASRGYVVFAIDYRHAPAAHWPAQLDDVRTALAWIREHAASFDADISRVAIMGRSAGGHLALMAAYTSSPLPIRAVVSYYGPTDLVDAYRNPPHPDPLHTRGVEETFIGGRLDQLPAHYREASPVTYATRLLPPTLLVYGRRDHIVESRYGAQLYDRLRATGTTAVLLEIPWAEHAFDEVFFGPSSQLALYHTERFLAWALTDSAAALPVAAAGR